MLKTLVYFQPRKIRKLFILAATSDDFMCNIYDEFSATTPSANDYLSDKPLTYSVEQVNNSQVSSDRYSCFNSDSKPQQPNNDFASQHNNFGSASIDNLMK
jgi:hypothetical protein